MKKANNGVRERFAERLRELRQQTGLSQTELANKIGISRGAISYYEQATRTPDIETLYVVASYFEVSVEWMLGIENTVEKSRNTLGGRIQRQRIKKGMTRGQLADDPALGIGLNELMLYEQDRKEPKIETIIKLARYFEVTTDYLLGTSGKDSNGAGSVIATLRREKGITQQALADSVQITRQMISAIEGGAQPSVGLAKKIAEVLNIEWSVLFEGGQKHGQVSQKNQRA